MAKQGQGAAMRITERREKTMLTKTVQDAINDQINAEFNSSYLYLSMSAYCAAANWVGSARWMRLQSQEEHSHATKLFDHVIDRGGRAILGPLSQPPTDFKSLHAVFQQVFEHEQEVTKKIHRLYELAVKENDYATQVMLQWFITEQVEEEKTITEIQAQLKQIGEQSTALFFLDRHLGKRTAGS
jgi:ferritin